LGFQPRAREEHAASLAAARQALDEEAFTQAWIEGQALTLRQAIDEVRREEGW
jgi:hypothetical protein